MEYRDKNINDNLEILRIGELKLLLEKQLYPVTIPKLCKDITDNIPGSTIQYCDKNNDVPRTYVIDDIEKCNDKKLLEKEVEEIVDYDDCLEVWVM